MGSGEFFVEIDAKSMAEGGVKVRDLYGTFGDFGSVFVGCADNTSVLGNV